MLEGGCDPSEPDAEGVQFICPGLMRTGLQSLAEALRVLGYERIIDRSNVFECQELWIKAMSNTATKEDFQKNLKGAQVVMGLPTFVFWEQILEAFPKAKVILTTRDEAAWYRSVLEAKHQLDSEAPAAPLRSGQVLRFVESWMMPSYNKLGDVLRFSWASALGLSFLGDGLVNEHVTRGMFRKHNMYVQERVPKDSLLVMDVREGWGPLCRFLDVDRPIESFPSVHDVPYFSLTKQHEHKRRKGLQEGDGVLLQQAMVKELQRGLIAISLAILVLLGIVLATLLQEPPLVLIVILTMLGGHLAVSIWLAVKYIIRRLPVTTALPAALKVIFVSIAINLVFLVYGILKEDLVTLTHVPSIHIVMASRIASVCAGVIGVWATTGLRSHDGKSILGARILDFAMFSSANELSTWAGYEMLKYVSFAVQSMAKSLTVLPSMIMGWMLSGTHFTLREWARAMCLVIAVGIMQVDDDKGRKGPGESKSILSFELQIGVLLTAMFLFFDAFCCEYQTRLSKRFPSMTHYQMMLGGSIFAVIFESIIALGTFWINGGVPSLPLQSKGLMKLSLVAFTSALGQILIYYTIKEFGSVVFAWIMTTRKVISVVFSLVWFGHPISWRKIICICVVFGIIILNQFFKSSKKSSHGRGHGAQKGTSSSLATPARRKELAKTKRFSRDNLSWSEMSTSATSGDSDGTCNSDSPTEEADTGRLTNQIDRLDKIKEHCMEGKKLD